MFIRHALAVWCALLAATCAAQAQTAPVAQLATARETALKPKVEQRREGAFQPAAAPAVLVGRGLRTRMADVARPLTERIAADYGAAGPAMQASGKLPAAPYILVGLERDDPALRALVAARRADLPGGALGPEGYLLDVTPERALIAAGGAAGAYYGARQLAGLDTGGKGFSVRSGLTANWPTMRWRGLHLNVGGHADMPALERILTQDMPRLRLNSLVLEINYSYQYKSHPEIATADPLTLDDCRKLKADADRAFVRVIPMINCLGHQSWAAETGQLLKTHPEFDETPDYPADNKGIYCRSWCPSNPAVTPFVCDLIDELMDAFRADSFHVGMDEVFILGKCPRCKGTPNDVLFAKQVNALHDHIVGKRHATMLMWGDRLLDGEALGLGEWEASKNGTAPAIDRVPKDIVMCDWHYETTYGGKPATYPSVAYFQQKGFRVWPSGWNTVDNARMLATTSLAGATPRMVGYLATTWIGVQPVAAALAGEPTTPDAKGRDSAAGVAAAIREGARLAWEG